MFTLIICIIDQILSIIDEVKVEERFPDTSIHTGHSCSKTAKTHNTIAKTWMIPGTARLGPEGVAYDDLIKLAFAANDVDHQVQVDTSIRVQFGTKIFGKCKKVGRKTCGGVKGTSRGKSYMSYACGFFFKYLLIEAG